MNSVKYRFWDDYSKNYRIGYGDLFIDVNGDVYEFTEFRGTYEKHYRDYINVERFTGQTDINGKDIYEGDIVKNVFGRVTWYKKGDVENVVIDFRGVSPCGEYDSDCAEFEQGEYWEVIGNIHENKELLYE